MNSRIGELVDWIGSGFFLDIPFGKDIIITNAHVVKNARSIEIMSMLTSEEKFEIDFLNFITSRKAKHSFNYER